MPLRAALLITLLTGCKDDGPAPDDSPGEDTGPTDLDQDGHVAAVDCDDGDASVFPGAEEGCNLGDDDCDGQVDEGLSRPFYADADADGYGNAAASTSACSQPPGYVEDATDCDDGEAAMNPGAEEVCDGLDNDCDGEADEGLLQDLWVDADGDGYGDPGAPTRACPGGEGVADNTDDCDDGEPLAWTGAEEVCDGVDNDCQGGAEGGGRVSWLAVDDGEGEPEVWFALDTDWQGAYGQPLAWPTPGAGELCLGPGTHYASVEARHDLVVRGAPGAVLSGGDAAQAIWTTTSGITLEVYDLEITEGLGARGMACDYSTLGAGGGVCCEAMGAQVRIHNSTFHSNTAQSGAAISCYFCGLDAQNLQVFDNHATSLGGGISSVTNEATIVDSSIHDNSSDGYGGGVYAQSLGGGAQITISNSVIEDNQSINTGGGAYFVASTYVEDSLFACESSVIRRNVSSTLGGGVGTGVGYLFTSTNCDFGVDADDNSPDDVGSSRWSYSFGDGATFSCDSSGCQ